MVEEANDIVELELLLFEEVESISLHPSKPNRLSIQIVENFLNIIYPLFRSNGYCHVEWSIFIFTVKIVPTDFKCIIGIT